ncbi:hypothetical protein PIB30_055287 [Stylosanthes scabra]|uniref:GRF-type domain-containing protein n=1 Tax=Stylosanthes scabra TaxID=79078 RepID=A0ABU6VHI1_9FABA|nr:hypothetical protein [Stylosanthes scabra]
MLLKLRVHSHTTSYQTPLFLLLIDLFLLVVFVNLLVATAPLNTLLRQCTTHHCIRSTPPTDMAIVDTNEDDIGGMFKIVMIFFFFVVLYHERALHQSKRRTSMPFHCFVGTGPDEKRRRGLNGLQDLSVVSAVSIMEIDGGVSSNSRRSDGAGRSEHSSGTQRVFVGKVGEDWDGVAPKCRCGVYAILYRSKTRSNPNRLFFGCPFFKTSTPHCKFFLWLDVHTAQLGIHNGGRGCDGAEDVDEHFLRIQVEKRLEDLEDRVAMMERKRNANFLLVVVGISMIALAVYVMCN